MEMLDPRTIFVAPASEDGIPIQVEGRENIFVKKHSAVNVAELSDANYGVR